MESLTIRLCISFPVFPDCGGDPRTAGSLSEGSRRFLQASARKREGLATSGFQIEIAPRRGANHRAAVEEAVAPIRVCQAAEPGPSAPQHDIVLSDFFGAHRGTLRNMCAMQRAPVCKRGALRHQVGASFRRFRNWLHLLIASSKNNPCRASYATQTEAPLLPVTRTFAARASLCSTAQSLTLTMRSDSSLSLVPPMRTWNLWN